MYYQRGAVFSYFKFGSLFSLLLYVSCSLSVITGPRLQAFWLNISL
uniref:Uncharacterized protein n=1 Tax=Nelumbo nucifera TaxID=4432 RepID=A0A822YSQ4_NELNU|nr:TPA_asm: hypothetical protein HUJ06_006197 [Nelumbo nucifera]